MIIRCLFGNTIWVYESEIKRALRHEKDLNVNFFTYCWGVDNYNFVKSLGLPCKLMSPVPNVTTTTLRSRSEGYMPKFYAIREGIRDFGKVIFLDWDCWATSPIPDNIFDMCEAKGPLLIPISGTVEQFRNIIDGDIRIVESIDTNWIMDIENERWHIYPCGCWVYCSDEQIINDAIDIYKSSFRPWFGPREEQAWQRYCNRHLDNNFSLRAYVKKFEPDMLWPQMDTAMFGQFANFREEVGKYIIKNDTYFKHDPSPD